MSTELAYVSVSYTGGNNAPAANRSLAFSLLLHYYSCSTVSAAMTVCYRDPTYVWKGLNGMHVYIRLSQVIAGPLSLRRRMLNLGIAER
jgi:hypothetical protein